MGVWDKGEDRLVYLDWLQECRGPDCRGQPPGYALCARDPAPFRRTLYRAIAAIGLRIVGAVAPTNIMMLFFGAFAENIAYRRLMLGDG